MTTLFNNTHDALTFAFNYSSQQYAISPMAKLALQGAGAGASNGRGKGLVALDGAAQAGMILAEIERLPSVQRACITARYAIRTAECKCCGSEGLSEDYRNAIGNLRELCSSQVTGMSLRIMRETIIRAFYERRISILKKAEELRIAKSTVYDQKRLIWGWLSKVDAEAQNLIADKLQVMVESLV
ncbi:hypothetical protein ACO0K9_24605 [Undibacterium sp. Ji50W]|uniref:hypothetical protein n=1 Tax=Undibacterium sp. Ji50W TaxID=3413041 RepID=UPI003BF04A31